MDDGRFSISAPELYGRLGTAAAPIIIDARREPAFAADEWMLAGAVRRPPDTIERWQSELSLGLTANFADDHAMLEHGMVMYDALYAWCRSLQGETHNRTPAAAA